MLNEKSNDGRKQVGFYRMEDLVPKEHVREIDKAIDFSFIYDLVKDKYSEDTGRPSFDPVVLFKIVFIQYLFGIRSMRQTIKEIEVNAAYRWFLGYDWNDPIPHFTTFGKNYSRRFEGTDIFEQIFTHILLEAVKLKYVDPKAVFIDSTHIKASANRNKKMKMQVQMEAQHYHKELMEEIKQRSGSTWEKEVEIKRLEVQTKIRLFIHFVLSQKSTVKVPLGLKSRTAFCLQSEEQTDPAPFVSLDCFGKLF